MANNKKETRGPARKSRDGPECNDPCILLYRAHVNLIVLVRVRRVLESLTSIALIWVPLTLNWAVTYFVGITPLQFARSLT